MLRPDQPIPDSPEQLRELARMADSQGNELAQRLFNELADLHVKLEAAELARDDAEQEISDMREELTSLQSE